jgi:hypothetical protein
LLAVLDPFRHVGKMISKVADGGGFHGDTDCITVARGSTKFSGEIRNLLDLMAKDFEFVVGWMDCPVAHDTFLMRDRF